MCEEIRAQMSEIKSILDHAHQIIVAARADIAEVRDVVFPPHVRNLDTDMMPRVMRLASFPGMESVVRYPRDERPQSPLPGVLEEDVPPPLPLRRTDNYESQMPPGPPAWAPPPNADMSRSDVGSAFIWPVPQRVNSSWARSPSVPPEESTDPVRRGPSPDEE